MDYVQINYKKAGKMEDCLNIEIAAGFIEKTGAMSKGMVSKMRKFIDFSYHSLAFQSIFLKV